MYRCERSSHVNPAEGARSSKETEEDRNQEGLKHPDRGVTAMQINATTFGSITIDGKTYEHDVVIRLDGEVVKRKKKLSKKLYGTSHTLSKDEAKFVFEKGCDQLILGSGQIGNVRLSAEAESYFDKKGCKVIVQPTPKAIQLFNRSNAKKIGLFHVTC
jgi:hypothetical protein